MSEKFRLDRKIGFQNTFYTKCINVVIDSIGPSIILRSINNIYGLLRSNSRSNLHMGFIRRKITERTKKMAAAYLFARCGHSN